MPWATFKEDFDYRTKRQCIIAYPAGYKGNIKQDAYELALAAGVLEEDNGEEEHVSEG